ncbi:folylpolyglutamate synthase, mitochondrial-like [Teleopsis dalmanni]|uniref:folylpolyglutamate synthase, mitochondrial n=1 Tax=Teleopsis dalmanni TaxID=139649 RepID=UPI0018CF6CF3|nr:folylpolyglutamate synthase, mitochondrial [Teleopsis dalmanni]XP_037936005.1 folylpolyglutamate synthase, mitochondrial-like [Teleopsis dalmanni]
MLLVCVLRSVSRQRASCIGVLSQAMLGSSNFEERVFVPIGRKFCSAEINEKQTRQINYDSQNVEAEYAEAIKALNTLQSNAEAIRTSITAYNTQKPLDDMYIYLNRSGLHIEEVDKLSVIHVSGTKGKGSTCALTESILRAHGVRTGFFSSPHLVSVTERIRINGAPISKEKFTRAFWRVFKRLQSASDNVYDMPAYFKFLTILCFHIFIEEKVDVSILEVGIGGELDCTNIIRNSKIIGITSLGLEHTNLLGNSLEEIAWQKAGIIKKNSNVFTTVTQPECLEVIKKRVAENNAKLYIVPDFDKYFQDPNTQKLLSNLNNFIKLNGSLAIQLACDWLRNHKNGFHRNYGINSTSQLSSAIIEGLLYCNWPGRCQKVQYLNFNVHLDGAHTIESMRVCQEWFKDTTAESTNPKILIFNTTGDRDSKNLMNILREHNKFAFVCFVPNIATSSPNINDVQSKLYGSEEQLKRIQVHADVWKSLCAEANEPDNSKVFPTILDSFAYIQKLYNRTELDVLVTGSLHLIGATILALNDYKGSTAKT